MPFIRGPNGLPVSRRGRHARLHSHQSAAVAAVGWTVGTAGNRSTATSNEERRKRNNER